MRRRRDWPDELLDEPSVIMPRHVLERLSWKIRRYERYLDDIPELDLRAQIVVGDKLDALLKEYRGWYEAHESERRITRLESFAVMLADRLETLDRRLVTLQSVLTTLVDRLNQE
jgi:hypothetical protein